LERIRISSIEPNLLRQETIDFIADSKRFVPHFHIPLQSGSNEILAAMRRRYQRELYLKRVEQIKALMPHACIGVDVIVGFPGESDDHFLETYHFLNALDISYLHVFTYSERENTLAANMGGVVPKEVRSKRSKMLRGLSQKKRRAFYESQLGTEQEVLFESENKRGYIYGFTPNYVKVKTFWDPTLCNSIQLVRLTEIDDDGLVKFDLKTAITA
jgi:threonylcarbamoyladenosine tRNA methylthiotransferase MtaB